MRLMSHFYKSFWHLILIYHVPVSHTDGALNASDLNGILVNGDLLIGVVVPIHIDKLYPEVTFKEKPPPDVCTMFRFENYQQFQAMRFAMDEINRSPDLLPNITLGYYAYDSCAVLQRELNGTLWMLSGQGQPIPNYWCRQGPPLAAIIGHSMSSYSILMAQILGLYRYPQISYFSTSSLLSDKKQFPSFFRTVPSDAIQSAGLAQLVLHFGWTWIGLLAPDDDYGQEGIQVIRNEIIKAGACVAFTAYIATSFSFSNIQYIAKVIKESTAKVVVAFSTDVYLIPLLYQIIKLNVNGKVFVASEAWSISNVLSVDKYSSVLSGTIGFAFYSSKIQGFREYLNSLQPFNAPGTAWAKMFWEAAFKCKFLDQTNVSDLLEHPASGCTGREDLEGFQNIYNDVSSLRSSYNIYTAVYVIAKALDDLRNCQSQNAPFSNGKCAEIRNFKPWQLLHYFKKVQVELSTRKIFFDQNGDPPALYDIVNWQKTPDGVMRQVKVGSYDTVNSSGEIFSINTSAVLWATASQEVPLSICSPSCPPGFRKAGIRGQPLCCFECVPCPQGEISNQTDAVNCFKCPWDMWPNMQKDKCLQKTIEYLSFEEPLGITLAATSAFSSLIPVIIFSLFIHYKNTPIVRANNYSLSCILLLSLSLCFLSSLAFIGFPQPEKCLLRQAAFGIVFALCVSCIFAKTIIVLFAFMATKPGSSLKKWTSPRVSYMTITICTFLQFLLCMTWMIFAPPFLNYNIQVTPGIIIIECNENSQVAFWCMLGYLSLLAIVSFTVAFLARRLPDSFNEAKFITFSMLAFLSVWVSFIPAYLSARGKYTVAMEVFAILSSSWALVICMFVPKCFIILFRPNMNSKEHLMGKERFRK